MEKIIFIDGLDRTGKSTMVGMLSDAIISATGKKVKSIKFPTEEFRESELWKSIGSSGTWNMPFIIKWCDAIMHDLESGIGSSFDQCDILLVDRAFVSTYAYQAALYTYHMGNDMSRKDSMLFYSAWLQHVMSATKKALSVWLDNGVSMSCYIFTDMIQRTLQPMEDKQRNTSKSDAVFEGREIQSIVSDILINSKEALESRMAELGIQFMWLGSGKETRSATAFDVEFLKNYNIIMGDILNHEASAAE